MLGLRMKLIIGFGSLLIIVILIDLLVFSRISQLGDAIDVILRENYRSVVACQNMKESLERIDSGLLMTMMGNKEKGDSLIEANLVVFNRSLALEKQNITVTGEQELVNQLSYNSKTFFKELIELNRSNKSLEQKKHIYFSRILPMFLETKNIAQSILELNQKNMNEANNRAKTFATSAKVQMFMTILFSCLMAFVFSVLTQVWVLHPIKNLMDSVKEVSAGNLDLVLHTGSTDEIGQLAGAFNTMTQALRERRRTDNVTLQRTRSATKEVMSAMSTAIAITDLDGLVEISTDTAQKMFGLKTGVSIYQVQQTWLPDLFRKAISNASTTEYPKEKGLLQVFVDFKEYFFQPVIIPMSLTNDSKNLSGTVILFRDMTQILEHQELKSDVLSTVSHQLKTPLTSLRMSIHLLQDERLGTFNAKQAELLQAAQEDSERLTGIIEDLLNIYRISNNQQMFDMQTINPETLVQNSVYPCISTAREKGIDLKTLIPAGLPSISADETKLNHVFANLINNALNHTPSGGIVTVCAKSVKDKLRFEIKDTGIGIALEHQKRLFQQFYRVPGKDFSNGVGLGLAIVKEIILAHNGEVGVESELEKGATFWFELPAVPNNLLVNTLKEVHK